MAEENQDGRLGLATTAASAGASDDVRRLIQANTFNSAWQRDKAILILRLSMWSGARTMTPDELMDKGIENVEEYLENHTPGSVRLVPKSSISNLSKIKSKLVSACRAHAHSYNGLGNVYFVMSGDIEPLVEKIKVADETLASRVREYLESDEPDGFAADMERQIAKQMRDSPSSDRGDLARAYPSADDIARKCKVRFVLLEMPATVRLSEHLETWRQQKVEEAIRDSVFEAQEKVRSLVLEAMASLKASIESKGPEQKINNRTIQRVRRSFEEVRAIADMVGGQTMVRLVDECSEKIGEAQSWSVEEARSLGIDKAVEEVLQGFENRVDLERETEEYLNALHIDEDELSAMSEISFEEPGAAMVADDLGVDITAGDDE